MRESVRYVSFEDRCGLGLIRIHLQLKTTTLEKV